MSEIGAIVPIERDAQGRVVMLEERNALLEKRLEQMEKRVEQMSSEIKPPRAIFGDLEDLQLFT